jgi:hypothetical protein
MPGRLLGPGLLAMRDLLRHQRAEEVLVGPLLLLGAGAQDSAHPPCVGEVEALEEGIQGISVFAAAGPPAGSPASSGAGSGRRTRRRRSEGLAGHDRSKATHLRSHLHAFRRPAPPYAPYAASPPRPSPKTLDWEVVLVPGATRYRVRQRP